MADLAYPDRVRLISSELIRRNERIAVAETTTGGLLQAALVEIPGASSWYAGGVIAYSVNAQQTFLLVSPDPGGSVSSENARCLAEAVRDRLGVAWGLAETGVAGPQTGRRSAKPAGLSIVAIAGPHGTTVHEAVLPDLGREKNLRAFVGRALDLLHDAMR